MKCNKINDYPRIQKKLFVWKGGRDGKPEEIIKWSFTYSVALGHTRDMIHLEGFTILLCSFSYLNVLYYFMTNSFKI